MARRSPVCSSAQTAIRLPGFENHSQQLGSNPVETKAQLKRVPEFLPVRQTAPKAKAGPRRGTSPRRLRSPSGNVENYFTSTLAPASVNFFLMASASSFETP